nr:membrane protein [Saccharospirillaceae bacterium]
MTEPTTSTAVFSSGLAMLAASFLTGLNPNTLIGAFAGASLFVVSAKDVCVLTRVIYLNIGVFMGYLSGPAMLGHIVKEPSAAAFVFSAAIVTAGLRVIDGVEKLDFAKWMKPPK